MIRLVALWAALVAVIILAVILREEKLARSGKVPLGRLRRFWLRSDRRRSPRYRLDWPIRYERMGTSSKTHAQPRDLSRIGAGVILKERLEVGDQIQLEFSPPDNPGPIAVTGRIVWIRELARRGGKAASGERLFAAGIQFHGISPKVEKTLSALLSKCGLQAMEFEGR